MVVFICKWLSLVPKCSEHLFNKMTSNILENAVEKPIGWRFPMLQMRPFLSLITGTIILHSKASGKKPSVLHNK